MTDIKLKNKLLSKLNTITILVVVQILLSSCGEDLQSSIGFVRKQPDEFSVPINRSLSIPENISSRPILPPVIISDEEKTIAKASELKEFFNKKVSQDEDKNFLNLLNIQDDIALERKRIEADLYGLLILSDKIIANIDTKTYKLTPSIQFESLD